MLSPPCGGVAALLLQLLHLFLFLGLLLFELLRCHEASSLTKALRLCIEDLPTCLRRLSVHALRPGVLKVTANGLMFVDSFRVEVAATVDAPHASVLCDFGVELARGHRS